MTSLIPEPASVIYVLFHFFLLHKSINLTTEPGSIHYSLYIAITRGKMGLIEIMSARIHTHTHTHTNIWHGLCRFLSLGFEENKHIGETLSIPFISLPQICCEKRRRKKKHTHTHKKTLKYQLRLQSVQLSSPVYKTNQPVLLAQGLPIFSLARRSAPTVRRRHERRERSSSKMASSAQFVSISRALTCLQRDQFPNSKGQHCQKWII